MSAGARRYQSFPDKKCLRGLHWVYRCAAPWSADVLRAALRVATGDRLVEGEEQWGGRCVTKLVLQFTFEVRLGARDDEISFFHRVTASPEQRRHSLEVFEAALEQALDATVPSVVQEHLA